MTGDDKKFDPFGGGERTVIRPNPGGRRTQSPQSPPANPGQPKQGGFAPMPGGNAPAPATPPGQDDWSIGNEKPVKPQPTPVPPPSQLPPATARQRASPPPQQPAHVPASPTPLKQPPAGAVNTPLPGDMDYVEGLSVANDNPITRQAGPLLMLLANLRITANQPQVAPMMEIVARMVTEFETGVLAAGVSEDQAVTAKYALCATADDIVQNMPGADRQLWTQYSMVSRFFQSRTSGVEFYDELAKVKANPALYYNLLELMHACLSLGFEGQYRTAGGGEITLQQIRRDVYQTLRNIRRRPSDIISPHWKGQEIKQATARFKIPVWAVALVTTALALAVFVGYRLLLSGSSEVLANDMQLLHPTGEVVIARPDFTPMSKEAVGPVDMSQLERIRAALSDDIAANHLSANIEGDFIAIKLLNTVLFASGRAEVKKGANPVIKRIAKVLDKEPNEIRIIGHTDNVKLKSKIRFKSNHDLSVKRAQGVADIFVPALTNAKRVTVDGRGPDQPVASNKTAKGRAANRRVEIMLLREQ